MLCRLAVMLGEWDKQMVEILLAMMRIYLCEVVFNVDIFCVVLLTISAECLTAGDRSTQ